MIIQFVAFFSLLQATLSHIDIADDEVKTEANEMIKLAEKLSKCLTEYFLAKEFDNKKFKSLLSSHLLSKCFQMKTWKFGPAKENEVPNYKLTIEFESNEKFTICVEHSKHHSNRGEESAPFIALLVGDTDNNLIIHSEDMLVAMQSFCCHAFYHIFIRENHFRSSFHLDKSTTYEKNASILSPKAFVEVYLIDYQHGKFNLSK